MRFKTVLFALGLAVGFVMLAIPSDANAQRRVPGYRSQPSISPYVLQRSFNNGGPASAYYGFIRPRQQLNQFVTRQGIRNNMFQQEQLGLQQSVLLQREQVEQPGGLSARPATASQFMPATFMFYSHYYQQPQFRQAGR